MEHDFDNPIYGDDQEAYATPVKPVPTPSGIYYSSADGPPLEYDYAAAPSGLNGPEQVYDSADDPSTAIPWSVYSEPSGTRKIKVEKPAPTINEYDYTTTGPVYANPEHPPDPKEQYEMMPTTAGSGTRTGIGGFDLSEHYDFGPN